MLDATRDVILPLPGNGSTDGALLAGEATFAAHALDRGGTARSVQVIGLGLVGQLAVRLARRRGASVSRLATTAIASHSQARRSPSRTRSSQSWPAPMPARLAHKPTCSADAARTRSPSRTMTQDASRFSPSAQALAQFHAEASPQGYAALLEGCWTGFPGHLAQSAAAPTAAPVPMTWA